MHVYFCILSEWPCCDLQTDIDVNAANFAGNTALHGAVVYEGTGSSELCKLLIDYKVIVVFLLRYWRNGKLDFSTGLLFEHAHQNFSEWY
jgi:ankyrin repeat protein